jgi:hypothetical protein
VTGLIGVKETASGEEIKEGIAQKLELEGNREKVARVFSGIQRFAGFHLRFARANSKC